MSYSSVETSEPLAIVRSINGPIVARLTLASIRMTTWPPHWIILKTGGFSSASMPRPGAPFSRLRRAARPFF